MLLLDDMDKFSSDEFSTAAFTAVQSCIDKVQEKQVFVIATVNNGRKSPIPCCGAGGLTGDQGTAPQLYGRGQIIRRYLSGKAPVPAHLPVRPDAAAEPQLLRSGGKRPERGCYLCRL